jgi:hypothetical protein
VKSRTDTPIADFPNASSVIDVALLQTLVD